MAEIVAKYPDNQTDYLLPIIKEKENERKQYDNALHLVNYRLKDLSKMLKLQRPLTMYVARHSWSSAAKAKNVPLSVISEGMGHDSEATTQIYLASLETSVVDKANKMILGLLEDRHARKSTIIASQLPVANWYDMMKSNSTAADAILDRIVHTAQRFELKGESLRKR